MSSRVRTIWYMGAKTRLLEGFIHEGIRSVAPRGGTLCDIFCGTGVVGWSLASEYRVIANDIHRYAATIARALLVHPSAEEKARFLASLSVETDLGDAYRKHLSLTGARLTRPLAAEAQCLAAITHAGSPGSASQALSDYRRFLARCPTFDEGEPPPKDSLFGKAAPFFGIGAIAARRQEPRRIPYVLALAYYANVYFGLRQAIQLDALRFAIDQIQDEPKRTHYLACLLYASSLNTSGTSHFAQPRSTEKGRELHAVALRRCHDLFAEVEVASRTISAMVASVEHREGNEAHAGDWREMLDCGVGRASGLPRGRPEAGDGGRPDIVYADPPYTQDQYARFYHALETLVAYDYPLLETRGGHVLKGRYPVHASRFASLFSSPGSVEAEFRSLAHRTARMGATLVVSYATTGLLLKEWIRTGRAASTADAVRHLRDLFGDAYRHIDLSQKPHQHSGQGDSCIPVEELLILCRKPRRKAVHTRRLLAGDRKLKPCSQ